MTEITYQSYDSSTDTVGGATFSAEGAVTLSGAQWRAAEHAGPDRDVDLLSVVLADGTDLVDEWETEHAERLR